MNLGNFRVQTLSCEFCWYVEFEGLPQENLYWALYNEEASNQAAWEFFLAFEAITQGVAAIY